MRQNKILQSESTDRLLLLIATFSSPSLITALESSSPIGKSGKGIVQTKLAIWNDFIWIFPENIDL